MATGSGKTFTAINFIYRLIKFAGAKRILFLVDRGNLGRQTFKEFQQFVSPYNNFKFTEEYIVQRLSSNTLDTTVKVCISTIQRLYSMLKGQDLAEEEYELSVQGLEQIYKEVPPIEYNPAFPIETFDFIVDAVGVCERDKTDSRPMDRKKTVSFEKLLQAVSLGNTETEVISSIAVRLARLNRRLSDEDRAKVQKTAGTKSLKTLAADLVAALDPDRRLEKAKSLYPETDPPPEQKIIDQRIKSAGTLLIQEAVKPFYVPKLRDLLVELQKKTEQTIDHISQDQLIEAEFNAHALEKARGVIKSFKDFIEKNKDELTALQILYIRPYKARLGAE